MKELNENFVSLYNRWSSGRERHENGRTVKTPYGDMFLSDVTVDYERVIKDMLINEFDLLDFYNMNNMSFSNEERKNIINGEVKSVYLLKSPREGTCVSVGDYDAYIEDYYDDGDEVCSEKDFYSIFKCLAEYMKKNNMVMQGKNGEYFFIVDTINPYDYDQEELEWAFDSFSDDFDNNFEDCGGVITFGFRDETNIFVEINYANFKDLLKMRDYVTDYFSGVTRV